MVKNVSHQARPSVNAPIKKRLLVLPFLQESKTHPEKVIREARRTVVRDILGSRRFVVISNSDFPESLSKFKTDTGDYDLKRIAPIAKQMGVAAIVEGKVLEIRARRLGDQVGLFRKVKAQIDTSVRIRVVASKSAQILLDEIRKGSVESTTTKVAQYSFSDRLLAEDPLLVRSAVTKAFRGMVRPMILSIEKLSWEGRVALVSGDRIFINAGRISGLQVGDILKVAEEGKEVFDPDSGRYIGRAPGRMKGTIEVVSYFGKDGAIGIIHSGSGFKENDRVEMY